MRLALLALALGVSLPLSSHTFAQDKAPKKKQAKQAVHKKPSPEQIRKFNELEKKQQK